MDPYLMEGRLKKLWRFRAEEKPLNVLDFFFTFFFKKVKPLNVLDSVAVARVCKYISS